MAYLFEVTDKIAFPNVETLLISPFKEIWERDTSHEKKVAIQELAYVEFMTSMKKSNPYKEYPEDRKEEVIRKAIIKEEKWEPDELVKAAMEAVIKFQKDASATYNYYISAKIAAEKMQNFFLEVNITERNAKDMPIYKPRDITSALNDTEKVLTNLKSLQKKVEEELYEESRIRGDKKISPFANPSSV